MFDYRKILVVCLALFLSACSATPVLTVKDGDMSMKIKQKAPIVAKVDISPDGRYALSGSLESFILWDIMQGKKIQTFAHSSSGRGGVVEVAFSPDGKYFASGSKGTKLWNLATRQEIMTFDDNIPLSIAFSSDGKYFLCGGFASSIFNPKPYMKIFNVATGEEISDFILPPKLSAVYSVAYSPDGKYILSGDGGNDGNPKMTAHLK